MKLNQNIVDEVAGRIGWEGPIKHKDTWYVSADIGVPKRGAVFYSEYAKRAHVSDGDDGLRLILKPAELPPKPDAAWLKSFAPEGKTLRVLDTPDLTTMPFADSELSALYHTEAHRDSSCYNGLRWGLIVEDLPESNEPAVEYWQMRSRPGTIALTRNRLFMERYTDGRPSLAGPINVCPIAAGKWEQIDGATYEAQKSGKYVPISLVEPDDRLDQKLNEVIRVVNRMKAKI